MHPEAVSGHFYIDLGLGIYGGGACLHSLQRRHPAFEFVVVRRTDPRPWRPPIRGQGGSYPQSSRGLQVF